MSWFNPRKIARVEIPPALQEVADHYNKLFKEEMAFLAQAQKFQGEDRAMLQSQALAIRKERRKLVDEAMRMGKRAEFLALTGEEDGDK